MKITKAFKRWTSAFKAGMIANSCDHCIVDDETETIFPCLRHSDQIAKLGKINEENWKEGDKL